RMAACEAEMAFAGRGDVDRQHFARHLCKGCACRLHEIGATPAFESRDANGLADILADSGRQFISVPGQSRGASFQPRNTLVSWRLAVCGERSISSLDGPLDASFAGFVDAPDGLPILRSDQVEADVASGGLYPGERRDGRHDLHELTLLLGANRKP